MFNLEQSVADWRRQMLAAGIKTPVPLEELEIHLRDEIERQTKSGLDERQAFKIAVQQIGPREVLQLEFAKNSCSPWRSRDNRTTKTNQILGALWLAQSIWFLIRFATSPVAVAIIVYFPHYWQFFSVFFTLLSSTGVIGSMLLFRGAKLGLSIIRIIAILEFLLCVMECFTQDGSFGNPNYWFGIFSVFSFITIWLLRSPKHKEPKLAVE
jgi:hypothetical protein